ncbi:MAG: hypothetical protein IPO81_22980 [Kouleothrix sp.]|nr:hypothetical protein [Kouleothrix sp.]
MVNHYDCLTIKQVQRIFQWRAYQDVSVRLKRLADGKVLDKKPLLYEGKGGTTWLYKVGPKGKRFCS